MKKKDISVILHNIRSAENVGAMFRTADATGVRKVFLTGYTPAPLDAFNRKNKKIAKSALGAEETVAWQKSASLSTLLRNLHKEGIFVYALEQSPEAVHYRKASLMFPCALIVGNEVTGLEASVLKKLDGVLEIPMKGEKESLNVSVAFGIGLYGILRI